MADLKPYADDAASLQIGELTLENGRERVAVHDSLDLTRDRAGLAHARALKAALDEVVRALEAEPRLPDQVAPPQAPKRVKNPFAQPSRGWPAGHSPRRTRPRGGCQGPGHRE
jgi:hypothetical protein